MITVIAEKPSVAKEIARVLGATEKKEGYLSGNEYSVTWTFGHLVSVALPSDYGIMRIERDRLPIIPEIFKLVPRKIQTKDGHISDPVAVSQLEVIRKCFDKCERIVVATDAGREGELIFRYIYDFLGCKKPFDRLWISSLTDKAIEEGFKNLRPGSEFDNLYLSAKARREADWLVGINASQALTMIASRSNYSLGRVQTPTMTMICRRYLENKSFTPQAYYQLILTTEKAKTGFTAMSPEKFAAREQAENMLTRARVAGQAKVGTVTCKDVYQDPPLPYDLTALQRDANVRFGFTSEQSLKIAQQLYEQQYISYPRTGSRYLTKDVFDSIGSMIESLESHDIYGECARKLLGGKLNGHMVNAGKVTDHHALVITGKIPQNLSIESKVIYNVIAGRLLESLSEKCHKQITTVQLECNGVVFEAKGSVTIHPGWRSVNGTTDDEQDETVKLPALTQGEPLPVLDISSLEKKTKPKPLYTEASLLAAMESCGKELEDERQREAMKMPSKRGQIELAQNLPSGRHLCKDSGLGTPATRAGIIELIIARDYVRRDKKSLVPTEKGLQVYEVVKDQRIADIEMTGMWEATLKKIESGEVNPDTFMRSIEAYTGQITKEILSSRIEGSFLKHIDCPKCGRGSVYLYSKVAKCNNIECGLKIFRFLCGHNLTDEQVLTLLRGEQTPVIRGFVNRIGRQFDSKLKLDDLYNIKMEIIPRKS